MRTMTAHRKPTSRSRSVIYAFFGDGVNETRGALLDCEKVLAKAKASGVILNYDDGRDRDPWFEAPPGPRARALRDVFLAAGYLPRKLGT